MKNIEKYIIGILVFVAVGAIGAAVYFGINTDKDNSKKEDNKQEEVLGDESKETDEETNEQTSDEDDKTEEQSNELASEEEKQIYRIYEGFNKLTSRVAFLDNDYILNILKGNDKKINDEYKFLTALYNADFTNLDLDSDEAKTIEKYLESKEVVCFTGKYVKMQDVNAKLKEFFNVSNVNVKFSEDIDQWWYYDESREIFYGLGCGGYAGPEEIVTDYEIKKVDGNYYVYQYVAFLNYVDEDKGLYGVYKDYDDFIKFNNNYVETTSNSEYKITPSNKDSFHKYAYKFMKNDKGNWYLDSIEMVK